MDPEEETLPFSPMLFSLDVSLGAEILFACLLKDVTTETLSSEMVALRTARLKMVMIVDPIITRVIDAAMVFP
jgi:hypothetical protein